MDFRLPPKNPLTLVTGSVNLDFEGVEIIGQAFADELFRVFPSFHPDIHLEPINTNENVRKMIAHVLDNK